MNRRSSTQTGTGIREVRIQHGERPREVKRLGRCFFKSGLVLGGFLGVGGGGGGFFLVGGGLWLGGGGLGLVWLGGGNVTEFQVLQ